MPPAVDRLPFTGDDEADRLLVEQPLALLIGFALDQQVTVQKAFSGPLELQRRLGHLDAGRIAAMDGDALGSVFREPPALHRFPGSMAGKVQALCATIASGYGGDASRVWQDATDGPDLRRGLLGLPGIGPMKADAIVAILGRRLGLELPGMDQVMPDHPTLGDVDSAASLAAYQAGKRARKAEARAAQGEGHSRST
ncbi:MAG: HhH-GPD-type base excision DNA repair protein [Candidatus Limnocylindrales bacterium]